MATKSFYATGRLLPANAKNPSKLTAERIDRITANDNLSAALGPGMPMTATPLDDTGLPRRFYYNPGYNLTPNANNGRIDFQTLRDTSRMYGLLRKCIEIRKNEMARLPWQILPKRGSSREKLQLMRANKAKIQKMEDFFEYPDRERTWSEWMRSVIEDHLVVDAATIYKRKTLGNTLYSLEQLDGTLIKPLLDLRGRRPVPPNPAFQQCILGIPREDFTSDELIYALLTPVVDSPYGFSPVEQNLTLYNLCMRWLNWSTAVFTDGSIPQMMLSAPENWTPDQIAELMELRKSIRAGDPRSQRDLEMLPHGVEAIIQNGGQAYLEFSQEIVDYLIDQTAISMDVTRQELGLDPTNSGLGGTGRADVQENVQYRRSLLPLSTWLSQSIFNPILKEFDLTDFKWTWPTLTDLDPAAHTELLKQRVEAGLMTWDDALLELGQEPIGAATYFRLQPADAFLPHDLEKMAAEGGAAAYAQQNAVDLARKEGETQLVISEKQGEIAIKQQAMQAAAQKEQATHEHGLGKEMAVHQGGVDQQAAQVQAQTEMQREQMEHEYHLQEMERKAQLDVYVEQVRTQDERETDDHKNQLDLEKLSQDHNLQLERLERQHGHIMRQTEQEHGHNQVTQGSDQTHDQGMERLKHEHGMAQLQAKHAHEQFQAGEDRDHQHDLARNQHLASLQQFGMQKTHDADQAAEERDHQMDVTREQALTQFAQQHEQHDQQQKLQAQQGQQQSAQSAQDHQQQQAQQAYQYQLQEAAAQNDHGRQSQVRGEDRKHQMDLEKLKAKSKQKTALKGIDLGFDLLPPSEHLYVLVDTALRSVPEAALACLAAADWQFQVSGAQAEDDDGPVPFAVDEVEKTVTLYSGARHFDVLRAAGMALDHTLGHVSLSPGFPIVGPHARTLFGVHFAGYAANRRLVGHQNPALVTFFDALLRVLETYL